MLGWHFTNKTERLRYGDRRKIKVGITHEVKCAPIPCKQGLHASKTVLDALQYAPGHILYRVRLSGKIVHGDDKSVATKRTYIARLNAEKILQQFARECALSVINLWDCPQIVRDYLESGDKKVAAEVAKTARAATWAAGIDGDGVAAPAANAAAWAAEAADTAMVAEAAAGAAKGAARAAKGGTWATTRAKQRTRLEKMVKKAILEVNDA